jgi:hypothetical protein
MVPQSGMADGAVVLWDNVLLFYPFVGVFEEILS